MTINSDRMKIIDRVIKLLSLAENNTFSEEAKLAKDRAAEMMAKHNIELSELDHNEFLVDRMDTGRKMLDKVEAMLMNVIARFNGVKLYTTGSTVWRAGRAHNAVFTLVGRECDIEAAKYMFDIVKNQMASAMTSYRKRKGLKFTDMTLKMKSEFRRGFTWGVCDKIAELEALQDRKIQEWGLVPVSLADQAANFYEKDNTVRTGKAMRGRGTKAGYEAGKDVSLHKGVNSTSKRLAIGH